MSLSWSNLPLDLLIIIRNKLHNADLFSFRSVCFQWRYASPIPNPCPRYRVESFNNKNNIMKLYTEYDSYHEHFIRLPFSFSSPYCYIGNSNGWLAFKSYNNGILHLFDPISNRKFILPPLYPKLFRHHKKVKPTAHDPYRFYKVLVTSRLDEGIAAASIVERNRTNSAIPDRVFIFYRHADGDFQRWSLLMEGSEGIMDIALAGDNRFYVIGKYCELYMVDERSSSVKLKKCKLWLPKHILDHPTYENSTRDRPVKCPRIECFAMRESGETDLKVYGYCTSSGTIPIRHIYLKINVTKLNGYSNNIEAACDVKWSYIETDSPYFETYFIPLFKKHHSKLSSIQS